VFDNVIKTANGHVTGIEIIPVPNVEQVLIEKGTELDVNEFHSTIGSYSLRSVEKTAYYFKLKGNIAKC
jgi:hypothetical protein